MTAAKEIDRSLLIEGLGKGLRIIELAPEISPATAKPWISRSTTSSTGASRPTWS